MGGGSGSGRSSLGDIKSLEERAKRELERNSFRRNTFLSFDYDDIDDVNLLRAHAKNEKSEIEFIDRSVRDPINSDRAEYIKQKISERIRQCSQTVVYISELTHSSGWVKWEVEKSLQLGKDVIAVYKGDTPPSIIPACISKNNIRAVRWKDLSENI